MDLNLDSAQAQYVGAGAVALAALQIGGKVVAHFVFKDSKKLDEASQIRLELRLRCEKLEHEIDDIRNESNQWRDKYYKETELLRAENFDLKLELKAQASQLTDIKTKMMTPEERTKFA